ncbi:MAG TPA: DUF5666 domain-containing protein [Terriglobales bacterium]|nr:DUF5666 domain-containing protein [Terriglobales bacterium]
MKKLLTCTILTLSLGAFAQEAPKQDPAKPQEGGPRRMEMRGSGTGGTIAAIEGQTIKLKTPNGGTTTVKLTDQTKFSKDRQEAKLSDFKVGDMIIVRGEEAGENTYTAANVMAGGGMMQMMAEGMGKQFIAGKVEKIDELKLTIARIDGQTQVIEVDENTSFRKQGESITLADIKLGDQVMGRGALKNGVFVPATLNVGQMPGMRMVTPGPGPSASAPEQKKPDQK